MKPLVPGLLILSVLSALPAMADSPNHAHDYYKKAHQYDKHHDRKHHRRYEARRTHDNAHHRHQRRERDRVVVVERQHRPSRYIRSTGRYLSDLHFRRAHIVDRHDGIISLRIDGRLLHIIEGTHHIIELIQTR